MNAECINDYSAEHCESVILLFEPLQNALISWKIKHAQCGTLPIEV